MDKAFRRLTKLIKSYDNILIMTHSNPDLDGFGSALVLYKIVKQFKKQCFIVYEKDENSKTIEKTLSKLDKYQITVDLISKKESLKLPSDKTLLIILDTHSEKLLYFPKLTSTYSNIVVIDHHIKSKDYIKNTKLNYINSTASSVNEIIANYSRYLNKSIDPILATILLAGMEIDTNGFNLKTSDKTYETAAYLIRMGADNIEKQELLKQDKDDYIKQQDFVKNSYMINSNMGICTLDGNIYEPKDLAKIAEEMLQFEDVEASFAIGFVDKNIVGVSARSMGNINVEKIMTFFNGGGHITNAACQIEGKSIRQVRDMIIKKVNKR